MKQIFIVGFLFIVFNTNAQWSKIGGSFPFSNTSPFGMGVGNIVFDKAGTAYVAGEFKDGTGNLYVAKWDGTNWIKLTSAFAPAFGGCGIPVICSIAMDTANNIYATANGYIAKWDGINWQALAGTFTSPVNKIVVDKFNNLYVTGYAVNAYGTNYVSKFDGTNWTNLDTIYSSTIYPGIISINNLATDVSGNVYAAGYFFNDSGNHYIAKWNGTIWAELGNISSTIPSSPYGASGWLNCLTTDANGNVYASGNIIAIDSFSIPHKNYNGGVAKWNGISWSILGGVSDTTFKGSNGATNIIISSNGTVYAAARTAISGSYSYSQYYKWDGINWNLLCETTNADFPYGIDALAIDNNGTAYAGGSNLTGTSFFLSKYNNNILPTKLLSFTATNEKDNVLLNWQTANEINVSYFNTQRSYNGKDFENIGKIGAKGFGNYSYTDKILSDKTIIYYSLQIIDKDGSSKLSNIQTININSKKIDFAIFPNPAKEQITIQGNFKELKIIDNLGKTVMTKLLDIIQAQTIVNISKLTKGVYFVQCIANDKTITEKLIVE